MKNSPKQVKLTFAPLKISEAERRKQIEKCKLASIAKYIALSMKKMKTIPNEENEENALILSTKLKSMAKARAQALKKKKKMQLKKLKEIRLLHILNLKLLLKQNHSQNK